MLEYGDSMELFCWRKTNLLAGIQIEADKLTVLAYNSSKQGCNMHAFFSFYLFLVFIPECRQQLRTMEWYTQIRDNTNFKSGL